MKHTRTRWQGDATTLWAKDGTENVLIARFDVSNVLRHETKTANARYAKAAVNFALGTSVEEIERLNARGISLDDMIKLVDRLAGGVRELEPGAPGLLPMLREAEVVAGKR